VVKLKSNEFAGPLLDVPDVTVVAVAELLDILTVGVPVYDNPFALAVSNTVPDPVVVMLPVPNAITLVFALLDENSPQDSVNVLNDNVPRVSVNVAAVPNVKLVLSVKVPPVAL